MAEPRLPTGDEPGFQAFFGAHYDRLSRALFLLCGTWAWPRTWRVFERWSRVEAMSSPEGYLYRTALNLHRSRLRHVATRRRKTEPRPGAAAPADPADAAVASDEVARALGSPTAIPAESSGGPRSTYRRGRRQGTRSSRAGHADKSGTASTAASPSAIRWCRFVRSADPRRSREAQSRSGTSEVHWASSSGSTEGSHTRNDAPPPSRSSTHARPPCSSANFSTSDSPTPTPGE